MQVGSAVYFDNMDVQIYRVDLEKSGEGKYAPNLSRSTSREDRSSTHRCWLELTKSRTIM